MIKPENQKLPDTSHVLKDNAHIFSHFHADEPWVQALDSKLNVRNVKLRWLRTVICDEMVVDGTIAVPMVTKTNNL